MVRTGRRAATLQLLLTRAGLVPAPVPPGPRLPDLPAASANEFGPVYTALGGTPPMPPLRPGAWDLTFTSGLMVELDEELHFNRYRAQTLCVVWADALPWHSDYLGYCAQHEQQCLAAGRWGRRWTTPPCEAMFGPAGRTGDLDGPGSPRWKQRALYDAMKDFAATQTPIRLARLSVWDTLDGFLLSDVLDQKAVIDPEQLAALLGRRTTTDT